MGGFTGTGNANLEAEESDSYTFGAVFDHSFGQGGDMTLSVDYFSIEIDNLIDTVDRQIMVDNCFDVAPASFPNEFCGSLTRDTAGAAFQQGELTEVNNGFINEGTLETEGVDLSMFWNWDLEAAGQLGLRMNYTYLMDFTETKFGAVNGIRRRHRLREEQGAAGPRLRHQRLGLHLGVDPHR